MQVHSDLAEAIGYFDWKTKKCGIRVVESRTNYRRGNALGGSKVNARADAVKSFNVEISSRTNVGNMAVKVKVAVQSDTNKFDVVGQMN